MKIKNLLKMIPRLIALLINLLRDPRVSSVDKSILAAVVAYALNPVDLVPDWIPFFGLADDFYLVALAIFRLLARVDESILLEYWTGPENVITTLKSGIDTISNLLPEGIKRALVAKLDKEEQYASS